MHHFRGDNGVFRSEEFLGALHRSNQSITFSGVGAHHQNGVAERAIKTTIELARAMLLHSALYWPDSIQENLWPFALDHAVYLWNNLPNADTGLTPTEIFTQTRLDASKHLARMHVWGCPAYVLHPTLQDGKKIPKWRPRARRGQFLGYSKNHSSTVGLIQNLRTGNISPQYHVVYDDHYYTVTSVHNMTINDLTSESPFWTELVRLNSENYLEDIHPNDLIQVPDLSKDWREQDEILEQHLKANQPNSSIPPPPPNVVPPIIPIQTIPSTPKSNIPTQMPTAPSKQPHQFTNPEPTSFQPHFDNIDHHPPSSSKSHQKPTLKPTRASTRLRIPTQKYFHDDLHLFNSTKEFFSKDTYSCDFNQLFLSSMSWLPFSTKSDDCKAFFSAMETSIDPESNTIEYLHPLALQTMANAEDTPTYEQAINGPYAKEFHKAMQLEFTTLNENIDSWDIIDYEPHMNVLSSTWSFKVKRYPDGSIKKLKARFCVRGYEQIEGVDYFDTYAPVVSWTTVRLLLVLSIVLNLFTCQVDYTAAFAQAPVTDDIYVEMPRGFKQPGKVLKLKRSLYGLKQSSRNWFQHLQQGLKRQGFVPSTNDPCLFIHPKVICLTYVDDCLFFAKSNEDIHNMINSLRADKFSIQMEDDFAGYLGVLISHNDDGSITLTQTGLIDRIIEAAHLSDSTPKYTPADVNALPQDLKGLHYSGSFNYASIVGMLNYLANNTRPDIAFAVHQCARYTFDPKASHEIALKRIVRYLCATKDRGFVINRPQHRTLEPRRSLRSSFR